MQKTKVKLLFISHDATRTGAPILLLNLAKALKDDYEIDFLLKRGGVLESEFKSAGNTYLLKSKLQSFSKYKIVKKIAQRLVTDNGYDLSGINFDLYDVIISNTVTNGDILADIRKTFSGKIISYIHELEMATGFFTTNQQLQNLLKYSSAYLVPARAVKQHLVDNLQIDEKKIDILHYYIPPANVAAAHNQAGKNSFVVGGVGTSDWRKSPDLFITIAGLLFARQPNAKIEFKWKGASPNSLEMQRLNYDLKKSGLQDKVSFISSSASVNDFYEQIDLFLLTSREDPYPLVVLEAAGYNHPTICFDGAGGAPEFVMAAQGGHISPYLNLDDVVTQILVYYNNPDQLKAEGEKVKSKLNETHHNIAYIKTQFETAIKNLA
jgi:glycosyltransferase involved in cell wall biosynthesis